MGVYSGNGMHTETGHPKPSQRTGSKFDEECQRELDRLLKACPRARLPLDKLGRARKLRLRELVLAAEVLTGLKSSVETDHTSEDRAVIAEAAALKQAGT